MASDSFRSDPERAAQLAVYLAIHAQKRGVTPAPGLIARTVVAMQKAARSAKRAAEYACSYPVTEAQEARAEKRAARDTARLNSELRAMVGNMAAWGATDGFPTVTLGGAPRGSCRSCGTLHIPGQPGDGWGDGFAIY